MRTFLVAGLVGSLSLAMLPCDASAKSRHYGAESSRGKTVYHVTRERRKTAVGGYEEEIGGYSGRPLSFADDLSIRALPYSPKDGGPYQDFSPVNTDNTISTSPYPGSN